MNEPTRSYEKIRYEVYDGVARITLDDPDTRNALSDQLLSELIGALEEARDDYAVRVVVLASSHEKVFGRRQPRRLRRGERNGGEVHRCRTVRRLLQAARRTGQALPVAAKGHVLAGSLALRSPAT